MEKYISIMFFVSLAAKFFSDYSGIVEWFKYKRFYWKFTKQTKYVDYSFRPWACEMCMSFWIMAFWLIVNGQLNFQTFILPLSTAAITVIINKLLNKL